MEKGNLLVKAWKDGAEIFVMGFKALNYDEERIKSELKALALSQMTMLIDERPDKNKTVEEQMNEDQKAVFEYLKKVSETGELD